MPEFLTCCHEESAVAMAHGYAKIEGKPMLAVMHGNIGMQHASMAIYNAYADRVPIYMIAGNHADGAERSAGVASLHSAQDIGALVRDYVKWDDQPYSLGHFAESAVRAYDIAMTPPMAPVLIAANYELQAHRNLQGDLRIPQLSRTAPPQGDSGAVAANYSKPKVFSTSTMKSEPGFSTMRGTTLAGRRPVSAASVVAFGCAVALRGAVSCAIAAGCGATTTAALTAAPVAAPFKKPRRPKRPLGDCAISITFFRSGDRGVNSPIQGRGSCLESDAECQLELSRYVSGARVLHRISKTREIGGGVIAAVIRVIEHVKQLNHSCDYELLSNLEIF